MIGIRPFRTKDTERVLDLANKYADFGGTTSEADLTVTARFPSGFWVAEDEGTVVGFAYGYFKDVPEQTLERWKASKVGYVELMAVSPEHRRKGIGKLLLDRLTDEFKKAGGDLVLLDCPSEALDARRLYERSGFEVRFQGMKKRL